MQSSFPIDLKKSWSIERPDNFSLTPCPVSIENDGNKLIIDVPFWGTDGMKIEILSYDPNRQELKGKYSYKDSKYSDDIIFKIAESGRKLIGIPEGIHGLRTWTLIQNNISQDLTNNSMHAKVEGDLKVKKNLKEKNLSDQKDVKVFKFFRSLISRPH